MNLFLLSLVIFAFILPSPALGQAFGVDPPPSGDDGPVAVAYSATFFPEPKCQGRSSFPIINFGCSAQCFPSGGVRSVLLEGADYLRRTEWKSAPKSWYKEAAGDYDGNSIADRGPLAVAYGFSDCRKETLIGRARIPQGHHDNCVTFSEPVFGWSLKLQWLCEAQRNRYNKHYEGTFHEEEYWNWRDPEPGQLEKWRELDALNREHAKKKTEPALDHSGNAAVPDNDLNFDRTTGTYDPSEIEDPGGEYGSSSGVGELYAVENGYLSHTPGYPTDFDFLDELHPNSNKDLDAEGPDETPFDKTLDILKDLLPVPDD